MQQQIAELQSNLDERFPTLRASATEISEQVGQAAAALKESVAQARSEASERASALIAPATKTDEDDQEKGSDSNTSEQ